MFLGLGDPSDGRPRGLAAGRPHPTPEEALGSIVRWQGQVETLQAWRPQQACPVSRSVTLADVTGRETIVGPRPAEFAAAAPVANREPLTSAGHGTDPLNLMVAIHIGVG